MPRPPRNPAASRRVSSTAARVFGGALACVLSAGCDRPAPAAPAVPAAGEAAPAAPVVAPSANEAAATTAGSNQEPQAMSRELPEGYKSYAEQPLGDERTCTAGVVADADGLQQRPVVAITGASRTVLWARHLEGLEDAYQARATHCVQGGDALFVLLQSDTDSSPALSQTLLSVARLDLQGNLTGASDLSVPEAAGKAYSAYVDDVPADFVWQGGGLTVSGEYFLTAAPDDRKPFRLTLQPQDFARR